MSNTKQPDDRLLSRMDVARIFRVSPSTVTRWAEAGKLPSVRTLGGHRRYRSRIVRELANQLNKEEAPMEKVRFTVPLMYGDHHVSEVRRILMALEGVEEVYASSCFQSVEITFDPDAVDEDRLRASLAEAGYLDDMVVPAETGQAVTQEAKRDADIFFRHTAVFEQAQQFVRFAQDVAQISRPLWPCPGVGLSNRRELEEVNNG